MEEFREGSRNDPRIVQVLPTTITIRFVYHEECHNNASRFCANHYNSDYHDFDRLCANYDDKNKII